LKTAVKMRVTKTEQRKKTCPQKSQNSKKKKKETGKK
jgi:hypothetical protein